MSIQPTLLRFKFEDFEDLPSELGDKVYSEQKPDCHGNRWRLLLYPGGKVIKDEAHVSVLLTNAGSTGVEVTFYFIIRDAVGNVYHNSCSCPYEGTTCLLGPGVRRGTYNFIKRSTVLDEENNILLEGSLRIDVHIQYKPKPGCKPINILANRMIECLEGGKHVDVSFKVGNTQISAHKLVLSMGSSFLYSLCEDNSDGSPIPINDVSPEIFRMILRYCYGEVVPSVDEIKQSGKDILDAANRFSITGLKIAVETVLVESLVITTGNVADWLIFADAKSCPLLKEYATMYFLSQSEDILKSESSAQLKESPQLLTELMMEMARANGNGDEDSPRNPSVTHIRRQLQINGLDADGSKEMLLSRWQEACNHHKRKREK